MKIHLATPVLERDVILRASVYTGDDRSIYLGCVDALTFEPLFTITTFLKDESLLLADGQIMVKNYAENDGMAKALEAAGLGRIVGGDPSFAHFEVTHPELLAVMAQARGCKHAGFANYERISL